jgi:tetratricopeptide (TPR) repeat protein
MRVFRIVLVPLILAFLAIGAALSAQDLTVAYLQGKAELQMASGTTDLSIGDDVPRDGTLKIAPGGYLELSGRGIKLTLTQAGVYSVKTMLTASRKLASNGSGKAVASMLSAMAKGGSAVQSTVMGVRGANESKTDQADWVTSDSQVFLDNGRDLIKSGDYPKAIEQLVQALDSATDDERPTVQYYLAYAYSLNDDTLNAFRQLSAVTVAGGETWAPDYVLLKAKLLADTFAFKDEVEWLKANGGELPRDAQRAPLYFFLLALGYRGTGDTTSEKDSLAQVVKMAPDSNLGQAAAGMMTDL